MKTFLFLILLFFISCQPSLLKSREQRMAKLKEMKEKFINCLKEKASKEFLEFIEKNESNLRYAIAKNKNEISMEDKIVVRKCKEKLAKGN